MNSSNHSIWFYAVATVLSVALGFFVASHYSTSEPVYHHAQLLPQPRALPEMALVDQQGKSIGNNLWRNRWSLVFFGFTSCPDICPLELQKLASLLRLADASARLQVVFISVDPERDTPARLREYVNFFHPDIVALSGSNTELANTANFFGAAYDRSVIIESKLFSVPAGIDMPVNAGNAYQVNHSARVFIVNPQGAYAGSFMPPFDAPQLWGDIKQLIRQ